MLREKAYWRPESYSFLSQPCEHQGMIQENSKGMVMNLIRGAPTYTAYAQLKTQRISAT